MGIAFPSRPLRVKLPFESVSSNYIFSGWTCTWGSSICFRHCWASTPQFRLFGGRWGCSPPRPSLETIPGPRLDRKSVKSPVNLPKIANSPNSKLSEISYWSQNNKFPMRKIYPAFPKVLSFLLKIGHYFWKRPEKQKFRTIYYSVDWLFSVSWQKFLCNTFGLCFSV